jgi:hypothetical protein
MKETPSGGFRSARVSSRFVITAGGVKRIGK